MAIETKSIDPNKPVVAFTFDDGPSEFTGRILDALEKNGVHATFFMRGDFVEEHPQIVARVSQMGHELAPHTWNHPDLTELTEDEVRKEIKDTQDAITAITGHAPVIFRPPYGSINGIGKKVCRELGLAVINWSLDSWDWQTLDADAVYNEVTDAVKDRDIILCHDQYDSTAEAAERILDTLTAQGYQFVTVSELFRYAEKTLKPGQVYDDAW